MSTHKGKGPFSACLSTILQQAAVSGLRQQDLARIAGLAPETVSRMRGRGTGDFDTLARLAQAVGLRITVEKEPDGHD